jgi:hypothetical protein
MLNVVVSEKTVNPGEYARTFKRIFKFPAITPVWRGLAGIDFACTEGLFGYTCLPF